MKICSKCKVTKNTTEFNKRTSSKDGLQRHCRECEKKNHLKHYSKNKEKYKTNATKNKKLSIIKYKEWKQTLVCECCDETDEVCIDAHHLDPSKKNFNISTFGNSGGSITTILKEMEKCVVVCSNCHRKIHKYGNQWYYENKRADGRVAECKGLQNPLF